MQMEGQIFAIIILFYIQVTLVIHGGLRSCESPLMSKTREMYNNCHFDVKLEPEFFHAKLNICITFPDNPVEGSTQTL
jgi:hypothetical protein